MDSFKITNVTPEKITVEFIVNDVKTVDVLDARYVPEDVESFLQQQLATMSADSAKELASIKPAESLKGVAKELVTE